MTQMDLRSWCILILGVACFLLLLGRGGQRELKELLQEREDTIEELQASIDARMDSIHCLRDSVLLLEEIDKERERELLSLRRAMQEQRDGIKKTKERAAHARSSVLNATEEERLRLWRQYLHTK